MNTTYETKKAREDTGAAQMKTGASGDCADMQTKSTSLCVSAEKPCYKKWMEFTTHCGSGQTPKTENGEQLNFMNLCQIVSSEIDKTQDDAATKYQNTSGEEHSTTFTESIQVPHISLGFGDDYLNAATFRASSTSQTQTDPDDPKESKNLCGDQTYEKLYGTQRWEKCEK